MSEQDDPPLIPAAPDSDPPESGDAARREADSLSSGKTAEELAAEAAVVTGAPRIPPFSVDQEVAAASANTGKAKAEEESLSTYQTPEQLQQRARQMEADRHQRFKDEFESIAIATLYVGSIVLGVLATIWALHLVLPPRMRWLSAEDLTHIQTLLTAGVLVGAVGGHFKKRLNEQAEDR